MRLNIYQQILQNSSLRWSGSFFFVTGVYACLVFVALNKHSTTQTILAPLADAVMIDLPTLPTTRAATPESKPEPVSLKPVIKPLSELPHIKTAEAILPLHTPPAIKENNPSKRKSAVLEQNITEDSEVSLEDLPPLPVPAKKPSTASQLQALTAWQAKLMTHIHRYKRYPHQARRRDQEAVIHVRVTLTRNGQVIKHRLEKASRYKALNREVLTLITRAQPLPPPPKEVSGETVEILLPVVFSLRR